MNGGAMGLVHPQMWLLLCVLTTVDPLALGSVFCFVLLFLLALLSVSFLRMMW